VLIAVVAYLEHLDGHLYRFRTSPLDSMTKMETSRKTVCLFDSPTGAKQWSRN
jgi:hypothetical protein